MRLALPELSLVVLIGASGSGKSTFARRHFRPTEVLSSDFCRGLVADDENDQSATNDAFAILHFILAKRLAAGRLTVVDATNVQPESRKALVAAAREYHVVPVAIVFDLPESICQERNRDRPDRAFGPHVIRRQQRDLKRSLGTLDREGFRTRFVMRSPEEVERAEIIREPLWTDKRNEIGPFDIIGDIHGCVDELRALLDLLDSERLGRTIVFLGDLVDRGPDTPGVLRLVMDLVRSGRALAVPGNHDLKLLRKLRGRNVQVSHGLAESLEQIEREPATFRDEVASFLDSLVSHYVLDGGRLVVAHAGMKEAMQGRASNRVRDFALFGETTGETDELGLPVRGNWAAEYRGKATVVYGHTPVSDPEWLNRTINIDTGCVFGGRLTALRYPELELVSVPAARVYYEPSRPFLVTPALELTAQQQQDDLLDIADVLGKRIVATRLARQVTIREEHAIAALEVMSRFASDPRWLIYLPPTMSPSGTSSLSGLLEHPAEAFAYYRNAGLDTAVCQEKHMGSRAAVIVCRDSDAARRRFGITTGEAGICYTRTGRRFFEDAKLESELLDRVREAVSAAGLWDELGTDWLLLDCELMPWSLKAQELLRRQYAPVGAVARDSLGAAVDLLRQAGARGIGTEALTDQYGQRLALANDYITAYQRYCWPVESLNQIKLAPFHLLASEGVVHVDRDHHWHLGQIGRIAAADPDLVLATRTIDVDLNDPASEQAATAWWEELTEGGGEGTVVKPLAFLTTGDKGVVQPALKVRGREYLRIIYGPEYSLPPNLERLRKRGLAAKRGLAMRELALGVEGLERFVRREPLRRVHECVFGVLALESEPVDPGL